MPHPFDATLKDLGKEHPADFLALFDAPPGDAARSLNADLSTVTASADVVYGLGEPLREAVHIDFQASADAAKGRSVLLYNALLHARYAVPVHSVLVLLRPQAGHSAVDGQVAYAARPGRGRMEFGYEVVRLWQIPAGRLLAGPLGTAPLAVLGALPPGGDRREALAAVVSRLWERIAGEAEAGQARKLLESAFQLLGLLVKKNEARAIFMDIPTLQESSAYQAILDIGRDQGLDQGREQQTRLHILKVARRKLGQEDEAVRLRLDGIADLERLERIFDAADEAGSWDGLLGTP